MLPYFKWTRSNCLAMPIIYDDFRKMTISVSFKSDIAGISQWLDGECVATIGRVKQTARAVEILGSWKVCKMFRNCLADEFY